MFGVGGRIIVLSLAKRLDCTFDGDTREAMIKRMPSTGPSRGSMTPFWAGFTGDTEWYEGGWGYGFALRLRVGVGV